MPQGNLKNFKARKLFSNGHKFPLTNYSSFDILLVKSLTTPFLNYKNLSPLSSFQITNSCSQVVTCGDSFLVRQNGGVEVKFHCVSFRFRRSQFSFNLVSGFKGGGKDWKDT